MLESARLATGLIGDRDRAVDDLQLHVDALGRTIGRRFGRLDYQVLEVAAVRSQDEVELGLLKSNGARLGIIPENGTQRFFAFHLLDLEDRLVLGIAHFDLPELDRGEPAERSLLDGDRGIEVAGCGG